MGGKRREREQLDMALIRLGISRPLGASSTELIELIVERFEEALQELRELRERQS
jgi:hypothetical protein